MQTNDGTGTSHQAADRIIRGTIITMDPDRNIIADGAVAIAGSRIVAVGQYEQILASTNCATVTGSSTDLITPGMINGHQHLTGDRLVQSAIPDNLPPGDSIYTWVVPIHGEHTPDDDELSATLTLATSLQNGITTTFEAGTVAHPLRVAAAARRVGSRLTVGTWGWDVEGGPYAGTVAEVIARQTELLDDVEGPNEISEPALVSAWVSLVGHDLMSDELVVAASDLARSRNCQLTFHISPSTSDIDSYMARAGQRPLAHLDSLGVLGPHVVLAHAVHIDNDELDRILANETAVVSCPWAYLRLGQGISQEFRHLEFWRRGGRLALGCDSENAGDAPDSLRAAALFAGLAKDRHMDPTAFGAHESLELLTIKGAEALGMSEHIGSIEVGKQADLVIHDRSTIAWIPQSIDPVLQLIWGSDGRSVRDVYVAGRLVVEGARVCGLDVSELTTRARTASGALTKRAEVTPNSLWPMQ